MVIASSKISHPLWLRTTHWLTAIAVIIMVMSGWQIYNASPIFPFEFSKKITLGGWLGGALQWHFAAMWLLVGSLTIYLVMNITTGRMAKKFFPLNFKELFKEFFLALRFKLSHKDLTHYNMLQKLAYLVAILDLIAIVCSGLVVWKSVQFPFLRDIMGGYDNARIVHFVCMTIIVGFFTVHVVLVAVVPRTLLGMTRGRF